MGHCYVEMATGGPQVAYRLQARSHNRAFIRPISAGSLPQVEVMFGGPPMALLSHQERPNASLRVNPPGIVSSEASTCPE